jgi:hypothetical protein
VVNLEDEEDISTPYTSQKNERIYPLMTGDLVPTHENTSSLLKGYLNSKNFIAR